MDEKEKRCIAGKSSRHILWEEYLTETGVSMLLGISKKTVRRRCRVKNSWGAKKIGGEWLIPYEGIYPVLAKPEHTEARAQIGQLRSEYSLHAIGYACILLKSIDDYNKRTLQYMREGKNEAESKVLALETCATSLYQTERLSSEYKQRGLRGLVEYTGACLYVFGCPEPGTKADTAYILKNVPESPEKIVEAMYNPLSIRWYMNLVSGYDNKLLNSTRKTLEGSTEGRRIVKANPNKRLYAVLKPTREENMERIEYVLTGIGPFGLFELLASVKLSIDLYEQDNSDTE